MTTTQEDRIIEKISQEVKKEIVKKYGSLQDTCSEAALAMKKLLDDEEFCVKIGLSGALRVERIRATYEWDENEYEHEYVRIGGIDYDPTQEQFSGFEINMEVIEENADFPPENFIDSVDDIIESVKKSFEEKENEDEDDDDRIIEPFDGEYPCKNCEKETLHERSRCMKCGEYSD